MLKKILGCNKANDLLIADRLYCNFFLVCDLMNQQADLVVPGHNQRRYDFRKGHRLSKKEHLVTWAKPRKPLGMSQSVYEKYPKHIQIREFKLGGTIYITTLLDEKKYPKKELLSLYQRRWEAEVHLNSIKTIMGMDKIACKSPDMVRKEIGVYFLAYTIIRYVMADAARQHLVPPNHISFKSTLQLFNEFMPYFSTCSNQKNGEHFIVSL